MIDKKQEDKIAEKAKRTDAPMTYAHIASKTCSSKAASCGTLGLLLDKSIEAEQSSESDDSEFQGKFSISHCD
jgi:hypothetical protein